MLTKDEILARRPSRIEKVGMPEWGGTVFMHEPSAAARDAFDGRQITEKRQKPGSELENFRAKMIVLTAHDEAGNKMFDLDDVAMLGELPSTELAKLFLAALAVGATTRAEADEAEKNS